MSGAAGGVSARIHLSINSAGVQEVGRTFRQELEALGFTTRWIAMPDAMHRAGHLLAERVALKRTEAGSPDRPPRTLSSKVRGTDGSAKAARATIAVCHRHRQRGGRQDREAVTGGSRSYATANTSASSLPLVRAQRLQGEKRFRRSTAEVVAHAFKYPIALRPWS